MSWPAVNNTGCPAGSVETATRGSWSYRPGDDSLELAAERFDLGAEVDHPARERPHGDLDGVDGFVQPRLVGAQPRGNVRRVSPGRAWSCGRASVGVNP